MLRIILIRPGETIYDQQERIVGNLDIPLTEAGRESITKLAESLVPLKLEVLYHCPCLATKETSEIIAEKLQIKSKLLKDFKNVDQGLWQGMLVEEVKHNQPRVYKEWQENPYGVCPPEGEMLQSALERVEQGLKRIAKKHSAATIGLVIGEPLASLIKSRFSGQEVGDLWKAISVTGHFEQLEIEAVWQWRNDITLEPAINTGSPENRI